MTYIGEFQKNSTISLEILTKDRESQPIATDYSPTATIGHYGHNGLEEVYSVTLEAMEEGYKYAKKYQIPPEWKSGEYVITYKVIVDGVAYKTQEKFRLTEKSNSNSPVTFQSLNQTKEVLIEEPVTKEVDDILPSDFQSPSRVEVSGNKITITPEDGASYNHTYRVVLDKSITSVSGKSMSDVKTITFTSAYGPLFATPMEVRSVLMGMYRFFKPYEIYAALRDAGQKAMQLLGNIPDPNNPRYREMRSTDTALFPTQKFVTYEASRILMSRLMVRLLDGGDLGDDGGSGGMIEESMGSIKLGDFSFSEGSNSEGGSSGGASTDEETTLEKIKALIQENKEELKFWKDSMMGHNRRGYARPVSASFRTEAGSPEGRDIE